MGLWGIDVGMERNKDFADAFQCRLSFEGRIVKPGERIISWNAHPRTIEGNLPSGFQAEVVATSSIAFVLHTI